MGCCGLKNTKKNNVKINPQTNNNKYYENEKNDNSHSRTDFIYNIKNKEEIQKSTSIRSLNINQKGDINNYIDIKKFEEVL